LDVRLIPIRAVTSNWNDMRKTSPECIADSGIYS